MKRVLRPGVLILAHRPYRVRQKSQHLVFIEGADGNIRRNKAVGFPQRAQRPFQNGQGGGDKRLRRLAMLTEKIEHQLLALFLTVMAGGQYPLLPRGQLAQVALQTTLDRRLLGIPGDKKNRRDVHRLGHRLHQLFAAVIVITHHQRHVALAKIAVEQHQRPLARHLLVMQLRFPGRGHHEEPVNVACQQPFNQTVFMLAVAVGAGNH